MPSPCATGVPVINTRSKRAAVVLPAPSRMFEDGGVEARVRLVRPAAREPMAAEELAASNWEDAHGEDRWRALWDAEIEDLPSHTESRLWLVTGLLLPIWDRLPGENMRVRRLATDAGESLLGRVLTPEQAHAFRSAFGLAVRTGHEPGRDARGDSETRRVLRSRQRLAPRKAAPDGRRSG